MSATTVWLTILAAGIGTYVIRVAFFAAAHRLAEVPDGLARVLRMIPPAALAALTVPALLHPDDSLDLWNARLAAGIVAGIVGYRTQSVLATLGAGFAALLVLEALVG